MKESWLIFYALFVVTICNAQSNISVAPSAGLGHAWMSGDDDNIKDRYHPSANFGAAIVFSTENHFGVGLDLRYSFEGGNKKNKNASINRTTRLNYLRVPAKAIYFFRDVRASLRPNISLGPSFGFLLGGKEEIGSSKYDAKDRYKSFDLGLLASAGVHYNLAANTWLQVDLNYYHGAVDVSETFEANRNRNLGINVGIAFGKDVGERSYRIQ